ncbi:MAG TPA: class I SAM-dependent methyltransferase [Actinomycetota bacterium]
MNENSNEHMAANRALWDEWTTIHETSEFYDLESFKAGGVRLRDYELDEVGDVTGKSLLHLQCHFGIDTLSWARLGARPTGVDYSERAIALATSLASELALDARFIQSNVYDLPRVLDDRFEVVYTSRGVIGWLPDLARWADVIAHFLVPGGFFYITEGHPMLWVFDDAEDVTELEIKYPYFPRPEPLAFPTQGSYADPSAHVEQPVEYSWVHSMGEIVSALAAAGLRIDFLHELPFVEWPVPFLEQRDDGRWWLPDDVQGEVPLFFSLKATNVGRRDRRDDRGGG